MKKCEVLVLGGGIGGYTAALEAAKYGKKTIIIEKRELGGTCLNRGCIPTKALLESSSLYSTLKNTERYGISSNGIKYDFLKIQNRKNQCIKTLRKGIESLMRSNKIEVIQGSGNVLSEKKAFVDDEEIQFEKLILATGSRPSKISIPGVENDCVIDSDNFLQMQAVPKSVIIIGGGVIGVEFATILAELDCKVTIIESMDDIISSADDLIIKHVTDNLLAKGISIICGSVVKKIAKDGTVEIEKNGNIEEVNAQKVILATGRVPNIDIDMLDNIGIIHDHGRVNTDQNMKTNIENIYACGDVTGRYMLAHVASREGVVAARNIVGIETKMNYAEIPSCVYTHPQVAWVGLTEKQAKEMGKKVKTGIFQMKFNGKAMVSGITEGFVKFVVDKEYGEILGAHIFCHNATELIGTIVLGMDLEATIGEIADMIFPHPTISESLGEVASLIHLK